ncbi:MAG: AAA family ATPase [Peptostreptococcaceae bacterium]
MSKKIILFSGPAGVGKSTTSTLVAEGLNKSAYISGDIISHMPISGYEKPWESKKSKDLVFKNIKDLSRNFLSQGYDVVIDWIIVWEDIKEHALTWLHEGYEVRYVVLWSDENANLERDRNRSIEEQMGERIKVLRDEFINSNIPEKYYLDNTQLELSETVSKILLDCKYIISLNDIEMR